MILVTLLWIFSTFTLFILKGGDHSMLPFFRWSLINVVESRRTMFSSRHENNAHMRLSILYLSLDFCTLLGEKNPIWFLSNCCYMFIWNLQLYIYMMNTLPNLISLSLLPLYCIYDLSCYLLHIQSCQSLWFLQNHYNFLFFITPILWKQPLWFSSHSSCSRPHV